MEKKITPLLLALVLLVVSCNNEDPILKKLEEIKDSLKQQGIKDSIHFERVDRLIKAGYTYEEAEAKVTEIENK
jgi:predicted Zn-ribbon and HTH transcriptional regulator